jgi:hypothetical protein
LSEELATLLRPDTPTRLKSVLLLWRHGPASRELGNQRIWILGRRRYGRGLLFVVTELDGAGRDDQNHHRDTCDN